MSRTPLDIHKFWQQLKAAAATLRASEDATGCSEDLTVVDLQALQALLDQLDQLDRLPLPPQRVVIAVEDGCVQDVVTTAEMRYHQPSEYQVVDYDELKASGQEDDKLTEEWDEACKWVLEAAPPEPQPETPAASRLELLE